MILSLLRCVGCRLFEVAEAYHITRCTLHGAARLLDRALYAAEREAAPVLIAGSLYLAGEVLRANGQEPD